jgi:AcrR family transcriptional regulator
MSSAESETRIRILEATWRLMEEKQGQGVRMSDIAKAAGVSRQALYLHFESRAELLVATTGYGDRLRGLDGRLEPWRSAESGMERLDTFIAFWGAYVPEIYGIARALLAARDTDDAAAVAWNERMDAVRNGCWTTIEALERDGMLAEGWAINVAVDALWTLLSIRNWEQWTRECGWSIGQYIERVQTIARRTFVKPDLGEIP